jgi:hypothetical protein
MIHDNRTDYNNRPSNSISFMSVVATTFEFFHCELVRMFLDMETSVFICNRIKKGPSKRVEGKRCHTKTMMIKI